MTNTCATSTPAEIFCSQVVVSQFKNFVTNTCSTSTPAEIFCGKSSSVSSKILLQTLAQRQRLQKFFRR
ncbi:MAG: hypothetical protein IJS69_00575 [Selenomonadaceae bacterium]|nr:hypothetical protein [Selenomonadaceae bacterium]